MKGPRSTRLWAGPTPRLWLVAYQLVACSLSACSLWPVACLWAGPSQKFIFFLVLTISYVFNFRIPTSPTITASVILLRAGQVASLVTTVEVLGQAPAGAWSIIGMENLTTKFLGALATCSWVHASRVGSQCLTPGVSSQTLKILFR